MICARGCLRDPDCILVGIGVVGQYPLMESAVVIKSAKDGAVLELSEYSGDYFNATLRADHFSGSVRVYALEMEQLCVFFAGMAENWRGWNGEREWASLEGELALSATSDSTGHVRLDVKLRDTNWPAWRLNGFLEIEAGQLDAIAAAVAKVFRSCPK